MNLDGLPYALRPMKVRDIPTVSAIEQSVFALPWSTTAFRYELRSNPASEYLVLRYLPWVKSTKRLSWRSARWLPARRLSRESRDDAALLGYGGFWVVLDEAHICTLALRPEWRGRGLGELLLVSLLERAIRRQSRLVTLEVRVSNIVAQNLYYKYGFELVGRRRRYYSDNREDALVLTLGSIVAPGYQARLEEFTDRLGEKLLQAVDPPLAGAAHPTSAC